jgi:hypothetical protein
MKSKVILANSKDPRYLDLKKMVDELEIWQSLDFECVISKKEKMKKIKWNDTYFPLSFSTTTYEGRTKSFISFEKNLDKFIEELIMKYEGGKIFVWSSSLEQKIFKLLIKYTKDRDAKNVLRIMLYNIIDLQSLFEGAEPLIMINNQIKSASLNNWSNFFEFKKTPIEAKDISFMGYDILSKLWSKEITEASNKIRKFKKNVVIHNEIDVLTISKIFYMIKNDKKKMIFLNELEGGSLKI